MKKGFIEIIGAILLGLAVLGLILAFVFYASFKRADGVKSTFGRSDVTSSTGSTSDYYNCGGITKMPAEYMPWVQEASKKYFGGDISVIVALIAVENNSWNPKAVSGTGAVGLGQFVAGTAKGYSKKPWGAFWGKRIITVPRADKTKFTVTKAEKASFISTYPDSARLQPGPSILAVGQHFSRLLKNGGADVFTTYAKFYHTYGNDGSQKATAEKAAAKLVSWQGLVKSQGCTLVKGAGVGATTTLASGDIVAQIPSNVVIKNAKSNLAQPTLAKKLGQLAEKISGWRVTEAYPPTSTHQDKNHYNGRAVDIALTGEATEERISALKAAVKEIGFDDVLDEYHTTTKYTTAGHIHLEWHGN